MEQFAEWLYANRKAAKLTQEELAQRAGCSKSYISMLERGAAHSTSGGYVQPSAELVDKIADVLNVGRAEARLSAGYAAPTYGRDRTILFAQRLDRILRRVQDQKKRSDIESILEKDAEKYVTLISAA